MHLRPGSRGINLHSGWAMAVGGMIGGGIYTLAGVILGVAGPMAWLSLLLGCVLALVTVRSYYHLTMRLGKEGVPVTLLVRQGHPRRAVLVSWWLIFVYVLAMGVYAFTFGHYLGRALGLSSFAIALCTIGLVTILVCINLIGIKEPAGVQITAVWIELLILATLATIGFIHWNPRNLTAGVPAGSLSGVVSGMAATFIAFEGFEMIAYDYRELEAPRRIMGKGLAAAVIAVGAAYALVTVGAGSLVGAKTLVAQKENALAVAGARAGGTVGLVIVTVAACASAASAVNATLFSVARLARASAEQGLMPAAFERCNRRQCPHFGIIFLGIISCGVAVVSSLEVLVQTASLAFLTLFGFVNGMAFHESRWRDWIALLGTLGAAGAAVIVTRSLAYQYPWVFAGLAIAATLTFLFYKVGRSWIRIRRARRAAAAPQAS
jgi:amino acid transporter